MRTPLPFLALLTLVAASCGKSSTAPTVSQVIVQPASASLTSLGETIQFTATALGVNGNEIAGRTATWSTSDSTVATVSGTGLVTAAGAGSATIKGTIAGVSDTGTVTVTLAAPAAPCTDTAALSLAAGQDTALDAAGTSTCILLPSGSSGDEYRVAVLAPDTSQTSDTTEVSLQVTGLGGVTTAGAAQTVAPQRALLSGLSAHDLATLQRSVRLEESTARAHVALRARERRQFEEMKAEHRLGLLPSRPLLLRAAQMTAASAPSKRVFNTSTLCGTTSPATGLLIYENSDLVFYQDSAQHASSPVKLANVQMMASYFSSYAAGMIRSYFGAIPNVDGTGKVTVFISPVVGSNEAAFVWSGDLVPDSACAGSNQSQMVYFSNALIGEIDNGNYQALPTLAHETKHIVSLYDGWARSIRADTTYQFEPTWVEEGIAEISGEMSSRIAWAANGGPAVGAQVTGSAINSSGVTRYDYGILLRLARTIDYLSSQPNGLTAAPLGAGPDETIYGSGWNFHRWLGDAYGHAGSAPEADSSLFRTLVDSLTPVEPGALTTVTGKTFRQLLEEFAAATSLDGTGAPAPSYGFTTYDFPSATASVTYSTKPAGSYPWPVTPAGEGFQSALFRGPIGRSGIRIYDFVSNGTGTGALIQVNMAAPSDLVVVRVR